jgi:hypothetical protein
MTIVGKILVFVNLVFSIFVGAFAVFSYTARYNYDVQFKDQTKYYKVAMANSEQFYHDAQRAKSEADARVAAVETQAKLLRDEIEGYRTQVASATRKVSDAEARAAQYETTAKAAEADVLRRQADAEKIRSTLADEISKNTTLVKNENIMRDRAISAEIQVKSLTSRLAMLENQFQESQKDLAKIKQTLGSGGRSLALGSENPPPENVEGLVSVADPGGLLKLTIGSDAGLAKGHTLELYRLATVRSQQSKYLGRVRILDVTPHEAVAQPLGRLSDKPQAGDHVASRILGGA